MQTVRSLLEKITHRLRSTSSRIDSNSGSCWPSSTIGKSYPRARRQDLNCSWSSLPTRSLSKCLKNNKKNLSIYNNLFNIRRWFFPTWTSCWILAGNLRWHRRYFGPGSVVPGCAACACLADQAVPIAAPGPPYCARCSGCPGSGALPAWRPNLQSSSAYHVEHAPQLPFSAKTPKKMHHTTFTINSLASIKMQIYTIFFQLFNYVVFVLSIFKISQVILLIFFCFYSFEYFFKECWKIMFQLFNFVLSFLHIVPMSRESLIFFRTYADLFQLSF